MAELRELLAQLGASDVQTLLNSGNATFYLHASPKSIDAILRKAISERFGFDVPVVTRTRGQLVSALEHDPLGKLGVDDSKYLIAFLPARPRTSRLREVLEREYSGGEQCAVKGREFYVWAPNGVNQAESIAALERSGATEFHTARNVRTVARVIEQM